VPKRASIRAVDLAARDERDRFPACPPRAAPLRARVHQCVNAARHEAVVDEDVLLDAERRESAIEVARAVILDTLTQYQVLRTRRRTDRVRLHESERLDRAFES
jgi:hypothetical protein